MRRATWAARTADAAARRGEPCRAPGRAGPPVADLARPLGLEAGLHACPELHPTLDPARVATAARERGVIVTTLDVCFAGPPDRGGLVLGYGGLTRHEFGHGARILAQAIRQEADAPTIAKAAVRIDERAAAYVGAVPYGEGAA